MATVDGSFHPDVLLKWSEPLDIMSVCTALNWCMISSEIFDTDALFFFGEDPGRWAPTIVLNGVK